MGFAQKLAYGFTNMPKMVSESSNDKRSFHIVAVFCAMMLNLVMPIAAKMVKPETVGFRINDVEKAGLESNELGGIDLTLEDGVLDALAVVEAGLGGAPQPGLPGGRGGGDVVSDEDIHGFVI